MLTWKLWEQLQSPPTNHPLFHQVQHHATPQIRFWKWRVLIILGLFAVFLINPNLFVPVLLVILLGFPLVSSTLNRIIHTLDVTLNLFNIAKMELLPYWV